MALNAKNIPSSGKQFAPQANIEPDVYPARLVQIIDLGLQPQRPFNGEDKPPANEIMFTYELVSEFMKDEEGNDIEDKPRWISETMPLRSLQSENARSTARYHAFDPENKFDGDFAACLEVPVNVTVVNNKSGDKIYDNVANVSPMSAKKAATCPDLVNPTKVFDLDAPDMEVFNALPKWIQEKIRGNLNFKGSLLEQSLQKQSKEAAKPEGKKTEANDQVAPDNNPF